MSKQPLFRRTAIAAALLAAAAAAQAVTIAPGDIVVTGAGSTIVISSRDPAGVGFNDTKPVAALPGNPATTLGEQRLNVYKFAAQKWADELVSAVPITVSAGWEPLSCTAGSATLGSAGAWNGWRDFPGAPKASTWYPQALANKLSGRDLAVFFGQEDDGTGYGNVDIKTQFNINLGNADCLAGAPFYLGLDGSPPNGQVNFAVTLLHELGHGLGFSVFTTSTASGAQFEGRPSIWEGFMFDNTLNKYWTQMTNGERVASAVNFRQLAWDGAITVAAVPTVLAPGATSVPLLTLSGPMAGALAGSRQFGAAGFGPQTGSVTATVMPVVQNTGSPPGPGCGPLAPTDAAAVRGRIALIDRGVCGFVVKVKNAQDAGAVGVLIANTATGVFGPLGGSDPTITIPSVMITYADGLALKTALASRSRSTSGVVASISTLPTGGSYIGTDAFNRPLLYTPNPRVPGSSVSHWDTILTPNQLMEPNISADLTFSVKPPEDLTLPLLKDLGW